MIKRTVEISAAPTSLSVRDGQLLIARKDRRDGHSHESILGAVPLEDLGVLIIDQRDTTLSLTALTGAAENGAAVCVCGSNHLPVGLLLPFADRHETIWRIHDQITTRLPTKKRLWRQIIRAKILGQSRNLPNTSDARQRLLALRRAVRSGDAGNIEAQAAQLYWKHWLGDGTPFRRSSTPSDDADPPNNLLNYGYAIMRAAVARAIVSAGLLPSLGIHHNSRSNSFCLADDLVEPLRPIVDRRVRELHLAGYRELSHEAKQSLLSLLSLRVCVRSTTSASHRQSGPLMVALHRYVASFVECIPAMQREQALSIPILPHRRAATEE